MMGLHSQHSFVFGIYFIQNKGGNGTVPADVFIIISLQHTAHCRMRPHGEAKGGEWRLLQPTVLSLFSPPPAPPNVPRPACSHPRHGWTFSNSPAEFASRSEKILVSILKCLKHSLRFRTVTQTKGGDTKCSTMKMETVAPCPSSQLPAMQSDTTRAFPGKLRGQNCLKSASTSS